MQWGICNTKYITAMNYEEWSLNHIDKRFVLYDGSCQKISNDIVKNKRIIFEALSFDYPVKNNNNLIRQDQFR